MSEHALELRGYLVVASKEGSQLGNLSAIHIDPENKRIAALCYRTRRLGGDEYFVPIQDIDIVGKDVVLISSESAAKQVSSGMRPPGKSLKELKGSWVTTMDGHHLGTLDDLDFSSDWAISRLSLSDGTELPVDAHEIKIGDEILVPSDYATRVQETQSSKPASFLRQALGIDGKQKRAAKGEGRTEA